MKPLCTADEMRALDGHAIEEIGIPSMVLMETAARGAAQHILQLCAGDLHDKKATILAGGGNNGGDGLVVARVLAGWGAQVKAIVMAKEDRLSEDTRLNLEILKKLDVEVVLAGSDEAFEAHAPALIDAHILVDALFGTGLSRPLSGRYLRACEIAEESAALKVSLDIPSGVHATDGSIMGRCFPADHCVTFGALKWGQMLTPGRDICRPVTLVDIGIPKESLSSVGITGWVPEARDLKALLPTRHLDAHKGSFGHVLVLAGSAGKAGAAILAGQGVLRSGAGLATIGSDMPTREIVHAGSPELMTIDARIGSGEDAALNLGAILDAAKGASALVIGPGLGKGEVLAQSLVALLEASDLPAVLDADAIRLMAPHLHALKNRQAPTVLTPHAGEMGAMIGATSAEVQSARRDAVRNAVERCASIVVLKGYGTLTATPEGQIFFNPTGGPWMATAGSGDVLAGCIAGLISQGVHAEKAAWMGVYVHGLAGDRLAETMGRSGLMATDLITELPATLESLRSSP